MSELYLVHHGVKGMKWGVRRYQNTDGSLTAAGRKRKGFMERRVSAHEKRMTEKANKQHKRGDSGFTEKLYREAAASDRTYKRYGKNNRRINAIVDTIVEDTGAGVNFYIKSAKTVSSAKTGKEALKGVGKNYVEWFNTPVTRVGLTGTMETSRKQEIIGNRKWVY